MSSRKENSDLDLEHSNRIDIVRPTQLGLVSNLIAAWRHTPKVYTVRNWTFLVLTLTGSSIHWWNLSLSFGPTLSSFWEAAFGAPCRRERTPTSAMERVPVTLWDQTDWRKLWFNGGKHWFSQYWQHTRGLWICFCYRTSIDDYKVHQSWHCNWRFTQGWKWFGRPSRSWRTRACCWKDCERYQ